MFSRFRIHALVAVTLVAALAVIAAACGDDDEDGGAATATRPAATSAAGSPTAGATAAGKIDISNVEELKDGTLDIGSDIAYAPIEFLDESNQAVGLDLDLANAMAEVLGVDAKFENSPFDGLIPALATERYDALMSAMTATDERKQSVDFIEYFNAGSGIIVAKDNPKDIKSADDLCGKTVAVQQTTTQADFLTQQDAECKSGGKDGITIRQFGTNPEAVLALSSGQADAEMADFPVAAYSAQQSEGKLEIIPNQIDPAPYGIAVRKTSTALRDVLQKAFDEIRKNGTYDDILEKWNLEAGALE